MNDCTVIGTIRLDDEDIVVICNVAPHPGNQHHDNVHGDWTSAELTKVRGGAQNP